MKCLKHRVHPPKKMKEKKIITLGIQKELKGRIEFYYRNVFVYSPLFSENIFI